MKKTIQIQPKADSLTAGIQEAIDQLKDSGGAVILEAGDYTIYRSIMLHANVSLIGQGAQSTIKRPPVQYFKGTKDMSGSDHAIEVEDTAGLKPGYELCIKSESDRGWFSYHGVVKELDGNTVKLEPIFSNDKTYFKKDDYMYVANWFPAIFILDADNTEVKNLAIDGEFANEDNLLKTDFTNAAIHTRGSSNILIDQVSVLNWPGDGIGVQQGHSNKVTNCLIDNCCGQGLHPGTGTQHSMWVNNVSKNNSMDGFFFCLNVGYCLCQNNHFFNNKRHGIGGLTKPDRYNIVTGNIVSGNAKHGIDAANSYHNIIEANIISNNSQDQAGEYAGLFLTDHEGTIVKNNKFFDDQETSTQTQDIIEQRGIKDNILQDNISSSMDGLPSKKK